MEGKIALFSADWLYLVLLGLLLLLLVARVVSRQRFVSLLKLPLDPRNREAFLLGKPSRQSVGFESIMGLISFVGLALVAFLLVNYYNANFRGGWFFYLKILLILSLFFLIKAALGQGVGWVFGQENYVAAAQRTALLYRAWLAVISFPLAAIVVYGPFSPQIPLFMLGILALFGMYLSVQFAFFRLWKMPTPASYKIFYLCALEITPLALLGIWVQNLA